jgi:hypothetical protein
LAKENDPMKSLWLWPAVMALFLASVACGGSAVPTEGPDAISTIVAATMAAITPPATQTLAPPTLAIPTSLSTVAANQPTSQTIVQTVVVPGATRINFLNGATTGVVSAPIQAGQAQAYVLQAFQAQPMLVNVDSLNHDVTLSIKTQGGTTILNVAAGQTGWQGTLPQTEDYFLSIHGGATTENFTLTVTIPSRIKFAEGTYAAKVSGKTVSGYSVTYTVFAVKGQTMSADLSAFSGKAALTIYGFTDGQPYVRSVTEQTSFTFVLPSTQDYIVEVVPMAGSTVNFTLTIKIQ